MSPLLLLTAGIGGELERTGAGGGVEPKKYSYGVYWKYSGLKMEKYGNKNAGEGGSGRPHQPKKSKSVDFSL